MNRQKAIEILNMAGNPVNWIPNKKETLLERCKCQTNACQADIDQSFKVEYESKRNHIDIQQVNYIIQEAIRTLLK